MLSTGTPGLCTGAPLAPRWHPFPSLSQPPAGPPCPGMPLPFTGEHLQSEAPQQLGLLRLATPSGWCHHPPFSPMSPLPLLPTHSLKSTSLRPGTRGPLTSRPSDCASLCTQPTGAVLTVIAVSWFSRVPDRRTGQSHLKPSGWPHTPYFALPRGPAAVSRPWQPCSSLCPRGDLTDLFCFGFSNAPSSIRPL